MKTGFKIKYYLLYGLILFFCLLYFRFPAADLKHYLTNQLNTLFPQYQCELKKSSYKFPYTLQLQDIILHSRNNHSTQIKIDEISISPKLNNPFQEYLIRGKLYQGEFTAILKKQNKNGVLFFDNIIASEIQLTEINKQKLSGELSFKAKREKKDKSAATISKFTGNLELKNGKVHPKPSLLTLQEIDIHYMKLSFSQIKNKIEIYSGQLQGTQLHGSFTGSISLYQTIDNIQLQGTLLPQQRLLRDNERIQRQVKTLQKRFGAKALPFRIEGRPDDPDWSIKR